MSKPKSNSALDDVAKMVLNVASVTAEAMRKERERNDAIARANWDTMSRRERPVFVHSLRQQDFTQQEIANLVGKSQSSIHLYEKQYKQMAEKKDTPLKNQSTEPVDHK